MQTTNTYRLEEFIVYSGTKITGLKVWPDIESACYRGNAPISGHMFKRCPNNLPKWPFIEAVLEGPR